MTIGLLVAVSPENVIGLNGKIPWRHPGDQRRFKRITMGTTIVMGRLTWESLDKKPLPGRRNLVLTSQPIAGAECFRDLVSALIACTGDVWFVGGAKVYEEAMDHADLIDVTYVPDHVLDPQAVKFPKIDDARFEGGEIVPHEDEAALTRRIFRRREG
jgi:dihydrofolate reductase